MVIKSYLIFLYKIVLFSLLMSSKSHCIGQIAKIRKNVFINIISTKLDKYGYVQIEKQYDLDSSIHLKKDQFKQLLIGNGKFYMLASGSGMVFHYINEDSNNLSFQRIDFTKYDGYNFEAINLLYKDTLFSIGGFGFWKNNGQIRYFSEAKEWELLFPETKYSISSRGIWGFDEFQGIFAYITEDHNSKFHLIKFDLSKKVLIYDQLLDDSFVNEYINHKEKYFQIQLGKLKSLLYYSDKVIFLDLDANTIKIEKEKKLTNFFKKFEARGKSFFAHDSVVYCYNYDNNSIDSTIVKKSDFIINTKIVKKNNIKLLILFIIFFTFSISIVCIYFLFYKNKNRINLNEVEIAFLKKLLTKKSVEIDIETINYIIGVSKKSIEIQKKNRSEFFNNLNQKLKTILGTDVNPIIRIKDKNDKRILKYAIDSSFYYSLQKLI